MHLTQRTKELSPSEFFSAAQNLSSISVGRNYYFLFITFGEFR